VWLQLAGLVRQAAAARLHRARRGLFQVGYGVYCWLVFLLLSVVSLIAIALLSAPQARFRFAHIAAKTMLRAVSMPLTVEGLERVHAGKTAVIVINHASYIDAIVL